MKLNEPICFTYLKECYLSNVDGKCRYLRQKHTSLFDSLYPHVQDWIICYMVSYFPWGVLESNCNEESNWDPALTFRVEFKNGFFKVNLVLLFFGSIRGWSNILLTSDSILSSSIFIVIFLDFSSTSRLFFI